MATVGPTNIPAFFNVDSDFRTWGSTISAALATLGLVQTADTGQINWTTVTKPATASTAQGYEVWKFNDSLQGTTPVFIKIEYGSAASSADRPAIWITVGSGSNGSGTLTGQLSTRTTAGSGAAKTAGVNLPFFASGNSGELMLAINVDTASTSFGFLACVERVKDSGDTTQADGCLVTFSSSSTTNNQYIPSSGSVPAAATQWCTLAPSFWSRSGAGASADASPVFIPVSGVWRYSHLLVTGPGDFSAGGTLTATLLGASHTYMALDKTVVGSNSIANNQTVGIAIRWE